jgi:hypothetical protein
VKKLIVLLTICLLVAIATGSAEAQKQYAFGSRTSSTLSSATTLSITPANTLTLYTLAADTSITFNAITSKALPGDKLVFKITANRVNRIFVFGNYLNAKNDTIVATKIKLYEFIFTGQDYDLLTKQQTN